MGRRKESDENVTDSTKIGNPRNGYIEDLWGILKDYLRTSSSDLAYMASFKKSWIDCRRVNFEDGIFSKAGAYWGE